MNHYKHLTIAERETIFLMRSQGSSLREIAGAIRRNCSSVSRELRRNSRKDGYFPSSAQKQYLERKSHGGRKALLNDPQLFEMVREHFCEDLWSPEEI